MSAVATGVNPEVLIIGAVVLVVAVLVIWGMITRVLWLRKKISHRKGTPEQEAKHKEFQAQMNTEVILTDEEKRAMQKGIWRGVIIFSVIFSLIVGFTAWDYWRFAIDGTQTQATVTKISKHRSSGKSHRTTYTFTLTANVNGETITDSYSSGSGGGFAVGDVVDAYAAKNGMYTDLAIADDVHREPFSTGIPVVLVGIGLGSALYAQRRRIQAGKAKIANLPKRLRAARIATLKAGPASDNPAEIVPEAPATTADGLPVYTIGGAGSVKPNDGSDYKS